MYTQWRSEEQKSEEVLNGDDEGDEWADESKFGRRHGENNRGVQE